MNNGLIHTAALKRSTESLGTYGDITVTKTTIIASFKCRFTVLKGDAETKDEGFASENRYKVISEPLSSSPLKGDFLTWSSVDYRVLWHKAQYDENGAYHHHSFVVDHPDA